MGLLGRSSVLCLVLTSACYAPEVRDCTVKCANETDCAADQVCSAGYCVGSPEVDCSLPTSATTDAGTSTGGGGGGNSDAGGQVVLLDAAVDAPPDAPTHGALSVTIEGKGSVLLDGIGVCSSSSQQPCAFVVPLATAITAHAIAGDDFQFDKWTTSAVCPDDTDPSCSFMPKLTLGLGAKFRKDN